MLDMLHKIKIIDGVLALGLILLLIGLGSSLKESKSETKVEVIRGVTTEKSSEIVVDIEGEVIKPGIYRLSQGSRISDVLVLAGGLAAKANRDWVEKNINRAQMINDGDKIYIPKVGEEDSEKSETGKISINKAEVAELETLPGVGPAIAKRIIDYRVANLGFKNVEEIKLVKGVGEKMWQEIKGKIRL